MPPQDADSVTEMRNVATGRRIMFARSFMPASNAFVRTIVPAVIGVVIGAGAVMEHRGIDEPIR